MTLSTPPPSAAQKSLVWYQRVLLVITLFPLIFGIVLVSSQAKDNAQHTVRIINITTCCLVLLVLSYKVFVESHRRHQHPHPLGTVSWKSQGWVLFLTVGLSLVLITSNLSLGDDKDRFGVVSFLYAGLGVLVLVEALVTVLGLKRYQKRGKGQEQEKLQRHKLEAKVKRDESLSSSRPLLLSSTQLEISQAEIESGIQIQQQQPRQQQQPVYHPQQLLQQHYHQQQQFEILQQHQMLRLEERIELEKTKEMIRFQQEQLQQILEQGGLSFGSSALKDHKPHAATATMSTVADETGQETRCPPRIPPRP